jgi:hypothetical protein
MKHVASRVALLAVAAIASPAAEPGTFDPAKDLISLHYDHAPDKDDGQSAAADRTILQTLHGLDWVKKHTVAVSGAYGRNADRFKRKSDAVMAVCWNDAGGWIAAHKRRKQAVAELKKRWAATLRAGGAVWVKEGGQSDLTADVVKAIRKALPEVDTAERIRVVQHSRWNENQTTKAALRYTRANTAYVRIRDANAYLNKRGGDRAFERAATSHPTFGKAWRAAFAYYNPKDRLDFSDTGELLHILGLGELGIDAVRQRFLNNGDRQPPSPK